MRILSPFCSPFCLFFLSSLLKALADAPFFLPLFREQLLRPNSTWSPFRSLSFSALLKFLFRKIPCNLFFFLIALLLPSVQLQILLHKAAFYLPGLQALPCLSDQILRA